MKILRNVTVIMMCITFYPPRSVLEAQSYTGIWCDEPTTEQVGVTCYYDSNCHVSGATPTENDWDPRFCEPPADIDGYYNLAARYQDIINMMQPFCEDFAEGVVGEWGIAGGQDLGGPYPWTITEEFAGWCVDGFFTCHFEVANQTCPS